jgi:hypothetical protein
VWRGTGLSYLRSRSRRREAEGGETLAPQDGVGRGGQLLPSGKVAPVAHIDVGQKPMGSLFSQLAQAIQPTERSRATSWVGVARSSSSAREKAMPSAW